MTYTTTLPRRGPASYLSGLLAFIAAIGFGLGLAAAPANASSFSVTITEQPTTVESGATFTLQLAIRGAMDQVGQFVTGTLALEPGSGGAITFPLGTRDYGSFGADVAIFVVQQITLEGPAGNYVITVNVEARAVDIDPPVATASATTSAITLTVAPEPDPTPDPTPPTGLPATNFSGGNYGLLTLEFPNDLTCNTNGANTNGLWLQLPAADQCSFTSSSARSSPQLLGWATTPEFPIAIARRQVTNGWGAYEMTNDDGQIAAVFIPAGGWTAQTAPGSLFPIVDIAN